MIKMVLIKNDENTVIYKYMIWGKEEPENTGVVEYVKNSKKVQLVKKAENDDCESVPSGYYAAYAGYKLKEQAEKGEFPGEFIASWQ